jgi:hypothetical protein
VPADRVIIEELFIRLPWISRDDAHGLSRDIAEHLGRGLAEAMPPRSLGALDVRIEVREGASRDEVAATVAKAILGALSR